KKKKKVIIVHGNSEVLINISKDAIVILTNGINLTVNIDNLNPEEVEVVEDPAVNLTNITKKLEKHRIKVRINAIPKHALEKILENRIKEIKRKIKVLKKLGVDTEDLEEELKDLEEKIKEGDYDDAYKLMLKVKNMEMVKVRLYENTHLNLNIEIEKNKKHIEIEIENKHEENETEHEIGNEIKGEKLVKQEKIKIINK
ncbi:cell wall binding repeat 2-containing protein, partial [Methanocaldococcus villosus KIN24-T80]